MEVIAPCPKCGSMVIHGLCGCERALLWTVGPSVIVPNPDGSPTSFKTVATGRVTDVDPVKGTMTVAW